MHSIHTPSEHLGDGMAALVRWLTRDQGIRLVQKVVSEGVLTFYGSLGDLHIDLNVTQATINRDEKSLDHWFAGTLEVKDDNSEIRVHYEIRLYWSATERMASDGTPLMYLDGFSSYPVDGRIPVEHEDCFQHAKGVLSLVLPILEQNWGWVEPELAPSEPIEVINTEWDVLD